ncbi:MAG: hypothetical protein NZZ60_01545 [Bacteroidia bacterium]|nr:hypothetical protein [Bacteroidia bacterium]MDW8417298.1 hypothetical protein [Bacteroidia bacterium]
MSRLIEKYFFAPKDSLVTSERALPPVWLRRFLRGIVILQIAIVTWDTIGLMRAYGIRRVQADCAAYLTAAQALLRGDGLKTPPIFEPLPYGWMHEWPLGYPAAIALTTKVTGLEPFYASRWLNVILLMVTYGLLLYFFREEAEWIFFFIYPPNYTWNVTYALSENLYIPLFVGFIGAFWKYRQTMRLRWAGVMALMLGALFLTRYASIAIGAGLALWGMWRALRKDWKTFIVSIGLFIGQAVLAALYFWWNSLNHPLRETGLSIRDMPMPPDLLWLIWELVPFIRLVGLVGLGFLVVRWLRGGTRFSPDKEELHEILLILSFTQAMLYFWSMWRGRVGIVDMRHFVIIFQPLMWYWGQRLWRYFSPYAIAIGGLVFLGWQIRNTYRHHRWAYEKSYVPYEYVTAVRQAYDSLPQRSCIISGSLAYSIVGGRTDICMGQSGAYFPILLRDCDCLYIDCGLLEERHKLGMAGGIFWPFIRYCDKPCTSWVCLRKIACASSPPKSSEGSP